MQTRIVVGPAVGISIRIMVLAMAPWPAVHGDTFYVSPGGLSVPPYANWESAATNLQDAIDAAFGGDTVLIGAGTYKWNHFVFINKGIEVRGVSGPAATILDAQSITRVMLVDHSDARVEGITLRNGSMFGPGGGLYLAAGTVSGCLIISNIAKSFVSDMSYTSGSGGGAFVNPAGKLENCIVAYNTALKYDDGINFEPGLGGGVFANQNVIRNCTITSNRADSAGGGIFFQGPGGAAENCILYFNRQGSMEDNYAYNNGVPSFTNCNINTLAALLKGTNNITSDPKFVNRAGDFHLRAGSPCIDAGANRAGMAGQVDYDGHARIFDEKVDIGADEAAFQAMGVMMATNGFWVTWDVVIDAPWQQEWSSALTPDSWIPSSSVITATTMNIMIFNPFSSAAPASNRNYRMTWSR